MIYSTKLLFCIVRNLVKLIIKTLIWFYNIMNDFRISFVFTSTVIQKWLQMGFYWDNLIVEELSELLINCKDKSLAGIILKKRKVEHHFVQLVLYLVLCLFQDIFCSFSFFCMFCLCLISSLGFLINITLMVYSCSVYAKENSEKKFQRKLLTSLRFSVCRG